MKKDNTRWRKAYKLNFFGLKDGVHQLSFSIEESFFAHFPVDHIHGSRMTVDVELNKNDRHLHMQMSFTGSLQVACDVSIDLFWLEQTYDASLIAKFGDYEDRDDDEVWVIDRHAHDVDLTDYFYETMVLNLPSRRINPDVINGDKDSDVYRAYVEYMDEQEDRTKGAQTTDEEEIDPRWQALNALKKDK